MPKGEAAELIVRGAPPRRWPAEWEPHRATWLSWPHNKETWPAHLDQVEDAFCEMVRAIAPGETVEINVADPQMADHVRARLVGAGVTEIDRIRFRGISTDDAWVRDHGGIFVAEETRPGREERVVLDFAYDAWGGKYPPWDQDARVAEQMAQVLRVRREVSPWVLEGGSIDGDGDGTILTTRSCLLNSNRDRPGLDRSEAGMESLLKSEFGVSEVLWLEEGIAGDDTDGHIDDLTRFVAPRQVVTTVEANPSDANYGVLKANRERLEGMKDAKGRPLSVAELPMPPTIEGPFGRAPASYANFYFCNSGVLMPVFGADTDREAVAVMERLVADRPVIPIPSQNLVLGLGSVHCLTQQEPSLSWPRTE